MMTVRSPSALASVSYTDDGEKGSECDTVVYNYETCLAFVNFFSKVLTIGVHEIDW